MLIDDFLSTYDFAEHHDIEVEASAGRAWSAAKELNLGRSVVARALFLARGLGLRTLTLNGLLDYGFVVLGERVNEELLLGLVGRFWLPTGGVVRIAADEFQAFDKPGHAKVAWNFAIDAHMGKSQVSTETRIACIDETARRWFSLYWMVVRPFSGIIRQEALRAIKRQAEEAGSDPN